MKKPLLAGLLAGFLALVPAAGFAVEAAEVIKTAINAYFVPGYERLGDEAALMGDKLDALCADPSEATLYAARDEFGALVHTFARVSMIRFGPVLVDNRLERLLFWPDRKSIALKQVQAALVNKDQSVLLPAALAGKSVGLQGLGALEFVLFGTDSNEMAQANDTFRCAYGGAIARNIAAIGRSLFKDWDDPEGIARRLVDPQPDNPDYRTSEESLSEFLGLFAHGVEAMRATEITPMLGTSADSAKPKSGLFWRSGLTISTLAWQAEGLNDLFLVSGLSDLLGADARWLGGSALFEFQNFSTTSAALNGPLDAVLADPMDWGKVSYLRILTNSLEKIFGAQIAGDLGLDLGFSALDGD